MGFGGISLWQLLIILAIVVLIFGTKKLKSMGSDLGGAVRGFKDSMKSGEEEHHREDNSNRTLDDQPNSKHDGDSEDGQK